jgi:ABC-type lipoprotein export system ATPase subunit
MASPLERGNGVRPSAGPMVEVHNVTRTFRSAGTAVTAVRDASLSVPRGEFLAIVGRSGSGKTTLLNLIAGLDRPDSGRIIVDGQEISGFAESRMTEFRRHTVGFVFQSFGLLPLLSAAENVELALRIAGAGIRERIERTRELLDQVGLTERAGHRPYELSGGEQQRVAVARALANHPRLLIADEPTGNLDPETSIGIMQLLYRINRTGTTVIMATHDREMVDKMQMRVIALEGGRVVRDQKQATYARVDA